MGILKLVIELIILLGILRIVCSILMTLLLVILRFCLVGSDRSLMFCFFCFQLMECHDARLVAEKM